MATMDEALKEAYATAPTGDDKVILHTLEVQHPTFFVGPNDTYTAIRIVRDYQGHKLRLENLEATASTDKDQIKDFLPYPFNFQLPDMRDTGTPELRIEIDNVGRVLTKYVESATNTDTPLVCVYRPYLSGQSWTTAEEAAFNSGGTVPDRNGMENSGYPLMDPVMKFSIVTAEVTPMQIRFRAVYRDWLKKKFPSETYTRERFPGLAR